MKVVAINGSPRKGGNTSILIGHVFEELQAAGIETEMIQIGGRRFSGCRACSKCWENKDRRCVIKNDPLNDWLETVLAAEGLLLASPTYFADVSSEMKAFIDRAGFVCRANGNLLAGKVGAALAAVRRAGALHALDTMNHLLLASRVFIPGSSYWNLGVGREIGQVENDEEGLRAMRDLGQDMARLLKALHPQAQAAGTGAG
jgi:multimeric flavodoxin WrbA